MALMERVATLIRANLNELLEQAEDPLRSVALPELSLPLAEIFP